MAVSPGGRPIDYSPLDRSPKSNWVEKAGGLPPYIRGVARAIARRRHGGAVTGADIAAAKNRMEKWAAGGDHVRPQVQEAAAAALAQWAALRAKAKSHALSADGSDDIELDWAAFDQKRGYHPRQKKISYVRPAQQRKPVIEPVTRDANKVPVTFAEQFSGLPPAAQDYLHAVAKLRNETNAKGAPDLSGIKNKKDRAAAAKFLRAIHSANKKKLRGVESSAKKQVAAQDRARKKAASTAAKAAKAKATAAKKSQRAKLGNIDGSIRSLRGQAGGNGRDAAVARAAIARLNSARSKVAP